jgi:hypothetical protein
MVRMSDDFRVLDLFRDGQGCLNAGCGLRIVALRATQ